MFSLGKPNILKVEGLSNFTKIRIGNLSKNMLEKMMEKHERLTKIDPKKGAKIIKHRKKMTSENR